MNMFRTYQFFQCFFFLFLGAIAGMISIYTGVDEVYTLHDSLLAVDSVLRYPYFDCGGEDSRVF